MQNQHRVQAVYIVPSDKTNLAEDSITAALHHLQAWYRWQMNGKTFTLTSPVVEVVTSTHNAAWYATNPVEDDQRWWFWDNATQDAWELAGVGFGQPLRSYVVYVEGALATATQTIGGTNQGYSGVAILDGDDCLGVRGVHPTWTQCRAIGGSGHELGHTFGLPHPVGDPNYWNALMGGGYANYSGCILVDNDVNRLNSSPFFDPFSHIIPPVGLCPFDDTHRPPTRRRPPPRPRPYHGANPLPPSIA